MDSLTKSEIDQIVRLQRDEGVRRLSRHFSWDEFDDGRCSLHQEFVYDVATFAASRGFSWSHVIRAAGAAKNIFPLLHDLDAHKLLSLFEAVLPTLTPVQQYQLIQYLSDTLVVRRRLFAAVVAGGTSHVSITSLDADVDLPPTPCPLEEGTDLQDWEAQEHETRLSSALQQKQDELRNLRDGPRVSLKDISVPNDQGAEEFIRDAVRAAEGQMLENLNREVSLLGDIQDLTQQQAASSSRGRHSSSSPQSNTPVKAKQHTTKTRRQ